MHTYINPGVSNANNRAYVQGNTTNNSTDKDVHSSHVSLAIPHASAATSHPKKLKKTKTKNLMDMESCKQQ